jgi:hypothetical protein
MVSRNGQGGRNTHSRKLSRSPQVLDQIDGGPLKLPDKPIVRNHSRTWTFQWTLFDLKSDS